MKRPVEISLGEDGIMVLTFTGSVLEEDLEVFQSSLDVASMAIKHQFDQKKHKVKTILDMTSFSGKYTAGALGILAEFAKNNTPYIEKSASFGGSTALRVAGETVSNLAGRDNIKVFATKEEALAWLSA